jgi:hypothetical protein
VADPVSWTLIEAGWQVVGADGKELGSVHEVLGDAEIDIFNGLSVSPGLLKGSRYVPSERVTEIVEGSVRIDLTRREFKRLDEAAPSPPSKEIRADTTDL